MAVTEQELLRSYTPDQTVEAVALLNVVERRINDLWGYRSWFRSHRWADWPAERGELDRELRALVGLLRDARRIAGTKPVDAYRAGQDRGLGYHDVQAHDPDGWPS